MHHFYSHFRHMRMNFVHMTQPLSTFKGTSRKLYIIVYTQKNIDTITETLRVTYEKLTTSKGLFNSNPTSTTQNTSFFTRNS